MEKQIQNEVGRYQNQEITKGLLVMKIQNNKINQYHEWQ